VPDTTTFLHLSDLHLTRPGGLASGIDALSRVRKVLAHIRGLAAPPAFIVVSGDLSDDGSAESYETVNGIVKELGGASTPVLLALGNHDDRSVFRQIVLQQAEFDDRAPYCHSQLIDGLQVIVLDSQIPGEDGGALGAAQVAWLEEELQRAAPRGNLIVLHHPCCLAGPAHHAPAVILHDAAALAAVLKRHQEKVLGVLAGHSHQANAARFGGVLHATAPAVLCQLDFFAGEQYVVLPLSGFNLCQIQEDDGTLIVHSVLLG
jgi:3',5'-cyclic-AMP phosphodiesterase